MKKYLISLEFIASQIANDIARQGPVIQPQKRLVLRRLLRHLRSDILEIVDCYETDRKYHKLK